MRAQGQKTSEGAVSAVCTRNNLCQHESNREETNKIREFEERLGAICGLGNRVWRGYSFQPVRQAIWPPVRLSRIGFAKPDTQVPG